MPAVLSDLIARGLMSLDDGFTSSTDSVSGFPVITVGHRVTSADVAEIWTGTDHLPWLVVATAPRAPAALHSAE